MSPFTDYIVIKKYKIINLTIFTVYEIYSYINKTTIKNQKL